MKQFILSFFLNLYAVIMRLLRTIKCTPKRHLSILTIPPASFGNLGDEAMMIAIVEYFSSQGANRVGFISWQSNDNWEDFDPVDGKIEICHHHLYFNWKGFFQFIHLLNYYDQFYCPGADVMDGYYSEYGSLTRLKYALLAAKTGAKAAILGFSFNNKPTPKVIQSFRDLPSDVIICARDPVSQERLLHHLQRPVKLVADLAFLLHPSPEPAILLAVVEWIERQRASERIIIGINANYISFRDLGEQVINNLVKVYVNNLVKMYSSNNKLKLSYVFIPHSFSCNEQEISDINLSEKIFKSLPEEVKYNCVKVTPPFSSKDVKFLCGKLDIVLTGRMHLAIACLGQGTPVACISYQGKVEGLFKHFDLEGMIIDPDQAVQGVNLCNFFLSIIEKREDIRNHIQIRLPKIQGLALENFKFCKSNNSNLFQ
ncbi:polysaccharide pyruvyl transferase family protein [Coleofasciculus sp. F4-SAH-05]|uniref:polysaccharide pyruvyl transferase family protein n=1 Tax=Coleofasciculus sp. F4-SAH-05 TaxID=3069525 RepID=UPI003301362C